MKNELMFFSNEQFGNIRGMEINGKPYVCATDVAKSLGYAKPNNAISTHCRATLKQGITDSLGRKQEVNFIPESDIYRLIFGSKLPSAEKFQNWVFEEVLPSIRKNGAYMTEETLEKALTSPDFLIQLATQLKEEQEARKIAEQKLTKGDIQYLVDGRTFTTVEEASAKTGYHKCTIRNHCRNVGNIEKRLFSIVGAEYNGSGELWIKCLNNNIVYESAKEVERVLNIPSTKVTQVCKGELLDYLGYRFEYIEHEKINRDYYFK